MIQVQKCTIEKNLFIKIHSNIDDELNSMMYNLLLNFQCLIPLSDIHFIYKNIYNLKIT